MGTLIYGSCRIQELGIERKSLQQQQQELQQQQQQQQQATPYGIPVQHPPSQQHYPPRGPSPPPAYQAQALPPGYYTPTAQQSSGIPMATAYAIPANGEGGMPYAPVVSAVPVHHNNDPPPPYPEDPSMPSPSAPSFDELPPSQAPPPPNLYAPVSVAGGGGYQAQAPRPPPPSYQQQQPMGRPPYMPIGAGGGSGGGYPHQQQQQQHQQQLPPGMDYVRPNQQMAPPMHSTVSGRKRALFIGITYRGSSSELRGCVNDCRTVHQFIQQHYGYRDIRILTDDPTFSEGQPTRANITDSLRWLVSGAQPGDSLFFHYSGHGGSKRDTSGDEADGYDETILPVDFQRAGEILDDELHAILVRPLVRGVRLTAIFDSCHSGSVMDLPFSYKVDGSLEIIQVDNRQKALQSIAEAGMAYLMGRKTTAAIYAMEGIGGLLMGNRTNEEARRRTEQMNQSEADVIQFGGCRDDQTSADARINGMATGAMSWAFVQALGNDPHQQYATLLKNMRQLLRGKYTQIPQISTSHKFDLFTAFDM